MRRNKLVMFLHLVWATWDRLPLITPRIERPLLRNIESEAIRYNCKVIALNCVGDHVHILLMLLSTISVADLVKQLKGVSSHFVNDVHKSDAQFKWQGSYGAFTVSKSDVNRVARYVEQQKEHHLSSDLWDELEACYEDVPASE
jgi:REP element-mobilizing transposase RayT